MNIRRYNPSNDFNQLLDILISEGEEWSCYSSDTSQMKYAKALDNSITFVAIEDGNVCGYSRSIDDNGFCINVCDLLIHKIHRGTDIGRQLMEVLIDEYPGYEVYVMSDVDPYYEKLGYKNEGTLFRVR